MTVDGKGTFDAVELVNGGGSTTRGLFSDGTNGEVTLASPQGVTVLFDSDGNDSTSFFAVKKDNTDPSNGTELFRVASSGYVGIGTNSPNQMLQVQNDSGNSIIRATASTSGIAGIDFGDDADSDISRIRHNNSDNSLSIATNNTTRITVLSDGKVGVGNTSPHAELVAAGKIDTSDTTNGAFRIYNGSTFRGVW